ncbi:amidohydrolase family protein [Patescibacteria group bacterium]|nr:amidohydrolase family protein [Patescibacteria group bacterium]
MKNNSYKFLAENNDYESRRQGRTRYTLVRQTDNIKKILIDGAAMVITCDDRGSLKVWRDKSIVVENGKIKDIFSFGKKKVDFEKFDLIYHAYERDGMVVTPGFINAHAHPPMYLLRSSMSLDRGNIEEQVVKMAEFEGKMTHSDYVLGAIGDFTEEQSNGITTTFSHYGSFEAIEEAAKLTKQNVVNAVSAISNSHPKNSIAMVERILKKKDKYYTKPAIAIHYVHRASKKQLLQIKQLMKKYNVIFTVHAAETENWVQECVKKFGNRTIFVLEEMGLLGPNIILSHAVHLTEEEIKLVKKRGAGIVHLPTSNKIHKSGIFNYATFYKHKAINQMALGTDSIISKNSLDLLSEALQTRIMHQDKKIVLYEDLFRMLTCQPAAMLKLGKVGKILPGYRADLSFWKLNDRSFIPYNENKPLSLVGNMITHGYGYIRDLMINGEFIISNRVHNVVDEKKLLHELQSAHMRLRKRMKK